MGDYGFKVSKSGYDVLTTDILNQVFNSSYSVFKTSVRDTYSSTASGERTTLLSSAFGYRPGFLGWFEVQNSGYWFPIGTTEPLSGYSCFANIYVDNSNYIYADFYSSASRTILLYYAIIVDKGKQ